MARNGGISGRTLFRIIIAIVALGILGWRALHHPAPAAEDQRATPSSAATSPAVAAAPSAPRTWKLGSLTLTACELSRPDSGQSSAAWCAPFKVPENRDDPHSRTITLRLAVVRSDAQLTAPDMVAFLAGGPGQAATETWSAVEPALGQLLAHRNVLLLDQRGTGGSNPLGCPQLEKQQLQQADNASDDPAKARAQTSQCLQEITRKADPRYYTTSVAVQDLDDARKALGVSRLDLVGVSYGTRVAQQYAMHYPEAVRSIVLDGVVPNELVLGEEFAPNLEAALKAQFARCSADAACKKHFGDPYQTLYQLRDALRANPHQVNFRDPETYQTVQRTLSDASLASVVRMFAYSSTTAALLPLSIDAAAHGDVGPLLGQAKILSGDLSDSMNSVMQYAVVCSEDADLLTSRPQDTNTILGKRMIDGLINVCSIWPKGTRPANFHAPFQSDTPTLLLSGQYDPATPPRYGDQVATHLRNARHLVLAGQGHNVIAVGCMPKLVKQFIETADPKALDARCLDTLRPTPIFIDFNGATP